MSEEPESSAPIQVQVTGELDLHTFHPRDLGILIPEYLRECQLRGILQVRIIHGKGTGALRTSVHALLQRLLQNGTVTGFQWPAPEAAGSWGATIATLAAGADLPQSPETAQ